MTVAHGDDGKETTPAKKRRSKPLPAPPFIPSMQQQPGQPQPQLPQPQLPPKVRPVGPKRPEGIPLQPNPGHPAAATAIVQHPPQPHQTVEAATTEQEAAVQYLQQQLEGPHGTVITVTPLFQH